MGCKTILRTSPAVSAHREEQEIHHKVTKDTKVRALFFLVTFVPWR